MQTTSPESPPAQPPKLRIQSLASGSSGNAYLLQSGTSLILIDCGIGIRQIQAGLLAWGAELTDLSAVVITHEHSDHVRALEPILRRGIQVHATRGTAQALGLAETRVNCLSYMDEYAVGDISLTPVPTSHDAAEPCGLLISAGAATIGLFTDMGVISDGIAEMAQTCELLILESNHDVEMLRRGPYPQFLKQRVSGKFGHLSNDQAGAFLREVSSGTLGPRDVWLAHLSGTNNTPVVAFKSVAGRYQTRAAAPEITVLPRGVPGPIWNGVTNRTRQLHLLTDNTDN